MSLLLFGKLLDGSAACFGIEQHSLVGREHLLDTGDVGQLSRGAAIIKGSKMLVAGQPFSHFKDFDVAVLQFPNLAFGEDKGRAFAI